MPSLQKCPRCPERTRGHRAGTICPKLPTIVTPRITIDSNALPGEIAELTPLTPDQFRLSHEFEALEADEAIPVPELVQAAKRLNASFMVEELLNGESVQLRGVNVPVASWELDDLHNHLVELFGDYPDAKIEYLDIDENRWDGLVDPNTREIVGLASIGLNPEKQYMISDDEEPPAITTAEVRLLN